MRPAPPPFLRLLRLLPAVVAAMWVLGIARFRNWQFTTWQVFGVFALAFALSALLRRARPARTAVALPPEVNPRIVATLAAGILGGVGLAVGGTVEYAVEQTLPMQATPWWLRTLWHGACAFAAAWFQFLARYSPGAARVSAPPKNRPG